jgi:hypothetical protein
MLATTRAAGPRSGRTSASDGGGVDFGAGMSRGIGAAGAAAADPEPTELAEPPEPPRQPVPPTREGAG